MKIIIVGCGKIGRVILSSLTKEGHDLTAIDNKPSVVESIRNRFDVMALCGNGTSYSVLKEAGAVHCDLFIAVTSSDELNMLSCFAAKRMGAKYTVARIRNPENTNTKSLAFIQKQLDLSLVINPELLTAQVIYNMLKLPAAAKLDTFGSDRLEMIELIIKPNSPLDGMTIKDMRKKHKGKYLICAILRNDRVEIPSGDFVIRCGDRVGFIVAEDDLNSTLEMFGVPHKRARSVIIIGAGIISRYLAGILLKARIPVKIVESDPEICREVCSTLSSKATVINGDGMSQDLLMEEGISSTQALVALTGRDEENLLISFYGMSQSVPKVVAKVNRDELYPVAERLGLDGLVSPRRVTANLVVKYARALENTLDNRIETLYTLMGGMAEALEFKVISESKCTGSALKDMRLKKGVLIAAIIRGEETIIPNGDDVIMPDDKVIVISAGERIDDLADILG